MNVFLSNSLIFILSIFYAITAQAYTHNKMNSGSTVKWGTERPRLIVHTNSSQLISDNNVIQKVSESVQGWSQATSSLQIGASYESGLSPSSRTNDLYFSSDSTYLGPSVAGVTITATRESSGELIEADIIINDSIDLSLNKDSNQYVGDIISHELGHYLGLAHSEVQFSTMFYRLSRGQYQLDDDDHSGVRSLYSPSNYASLSGRIIGGNSLIGVLGAHVQAFSLGSGDVAGSAISDKDGKFVVKGLNGNDHYYLYIDKLKSPENLPSRYSEVKTDFCYSGRPYRGSFYQSCFTRDEGRPQAIHISARESKSVGDITIRCGLETPIDYMQAKPSSILSLNLKEFGRDKLHVGESIVGFFNQGDVEDQVPDLFEFAVNLSDLPTPSGGENYFVEVKTISQGLSSPIRLSMELENSDSILLSSQTTDTVETRLDGALNLENTLRIPIILDDPAANDFFLRITPESITEFTQRTGTSVNRFIPDYSRFADPLNFYFLSIHIVKESDGPFSYVSSESGSDVSSNRLCPDAPETYSVDETGVLSSQLGDFSSSRSNSTELNALGCGMILLDSNNQPPGGGSGAVLLCLFGLCFLLINIASQQVEKFDF